MKKTQYMWGIFTPRNKLLIREIGIKRRCVTFNFAGSFWESYLRMGYTVRKLKLEEVK